MGTAPYNEFALLCPAAQDKTPDPMEVKELYELFPKGPANGSEHRERAREQEVAGGGRCRAAPAGEDRRPATAKLRAVQHVVVHERGHVKKLDGHRGGHEVVGGLVPRADEHEHRPQPLAAGAERPADVPLQLCAITHRHLPQPVLGALE